MNQTKKEQVLLSWFKKRIKGYNNINIEDFNSESWKNGLALCAILHSYQPDLIDLNSLNKTNVGKNFQIALNVAEKLGIPKLIDKQDLMEQNINKSLIINYLLSIYHILENGKLDSNLKRENEQTKGFLL